jgi:hypothetical protein
MDKREERPQFLTRLGRGLRRAFGPPPLRCARCGMLVLPDDESADFDHRVYHAQCLDRLLGG